VVKVLSNNWYQSQCHDFDSEWDNCL